MNQRVLVSLGVVNPAEVNSEEALLQFVNGPDNRLTQTTVINSYTINITYRLTDLLVPYLNSPVHREVSKLSKKEYSKI